MATLCFVFALAYVLLSSGRHCLESEDCCEDVEGGQSWLDRLRSAWNTVVKSATQLWRDCVGEMKARAKDLGALTRETWYSVREEVVRWLRGREDLSESQRVEMIEAVQKMEMPPQKED